MDLQTAIALRAAAVERRGAPPPPPIVRLAGETYKPAPTSDVVGLLAASGIVAMTKLWDGSPIDGSASDPTQPPTAAPVNTSPPVITPVTDFAIGSQLVGTVGAWTLNPSFRRQWTRQGSAIFGQTASSYIINPLDAGFTIGCIIFATSSEGAVASASAVPVGPILPAA
jgi:hypothetical protein